MSDFCVGNLIIGYAGQDGTLLCCELDKLGESWLGIDSVTAEARRFEGRTEWVSVGDADAVSTLIRDTSPRRIFYLAAVHRSSQKSFEHSIYDRYKSELTVNVHGALNCLEAIRKHSPKTRLVYASSSLIFASTPSPSVRLDERSPTDPRESYALEKLLVGKACAEYRSAFDLHASVAILFNHESPYRPPGFLSHYVAKSIQEMLRGEREVMEIGDLTATVDWMYAGDTVRAMLAISEQEVADDYVVASGVPHTVEDFLQAAFMAAGLEMAGRVRVAANRLERTPGCRIGNPGHLRKVTGWHPLVEFQDMVASLISAGGRSGAQPTDYHTKG